MELKRRCNVFSTFIVKQNLNYFPMSVLHSVLTARFGGRPAGHWVVMKANIGGVDIFVMAYAWSSKGVAYMVSSCGKTVMHKDAYVSRFDDEFGNVIEKELPDRLLHTFCLSFFP